MMQMQQNSMQMQQNMMRHSNHFCFFTKNNPRKMKADKNSIKYFDDVHSSYILDVSNKTGSIFMLNQKDLCVIDPKQLEEILHKNTSKKIYDEYDFGGDDPVELTMTRLSPCETLMAIVNPSNIVVIYLPDFLSQKEPKVETNFEINGHSYAYIEWPPLNDIYCAKKYFLTLDTAGKLRTHFISSDEMFSNLDEHFRCATFSVDGGLIYAINYHQELFIIDPLNVQIVSRRRIVELETTSTIISIQMMQISPKIMVIGSLTKSLQDPIENSVPYLLLLSGDLLDPNAGFNRVDFKMHLSQAIKPERLPDFRFHYVKERQLLLFSHTESSRVQALQLDGDLEELQSIDIDSASIRGFVFYRGAFSREEKSQMVQVEYQNRRFALPNGPRIFVLDSEGFMHHFNYYDTRYVLHNQSLLVDPMKVEVLKSFRPVPTIIANRSMIPPSSPRGGLMIGNGNMNMMGGNNMNNGGMMGNNNNPFGLGQMNNNSSGGGGGMGEESGNDQAFKMKKPRMTDDDNSKMNTQSLFPPNNQQMNNNNPFPNMMNNGGMMGNNSNMMNNNSNINGRELRSGTMMPPKVNIVPPQQTQMPTGNNNATMPPSVRDLMNQRKIHKLSIAQNEGGQNQMNQMNQMGGNLQGNNNVNPNLNQGIQQQQNNAVNPFARQQQNNAVNPFASQQNNQQVNPFASQQNNMMNNNNGMSSNLPTPILTNQQSFNPNQQQQGNNNSMPPPQSMGMGGMGNNFQSNLQNKPVNPFAAQQQQQNPQQRNIGLQNQNQQQQNNNGMQQGSGSQMPNTLQFQSQSQGAQSSLNPNVGSINPNAQNSLQQQQQQQQGMRMQQQQQGNGDLHFQQQPNMMMNNQGQMYVGPTPEQILAERIREQEEIVKKNKGLFEGISVHMRKAGMAFDEAKDLFPQRRKELLHWLKRQKVRDFGNLKRIYKQFFDDSSALDLELILLGQELDAKANIIRDTKEEDAHSKILKSLMTEAKKRNAKVDSHIGIGQKYLENQEKILGVTPGLEPRKIEYRETDGAETIQFFSQGGGGSKLGKSSLTKSFKQSLGGGQRPAAFGQQKERIDLFGDENINPKTGNFPRFDKTYEHRKRATEEKWMKVQEISNTIFEERAKDVEDITKRLRKAKKQHTAKQREAEVSKKKIIFFDLSEDSSDESDEIKSAVNQENKDLNETSVKPQVSYEKIDKFFSQILMDLSSKYHFDEILQSSHQQSFDYSSPQEVKPKNNLLNRPSYSKLHEPSIQTTPNSSMNDLLLRVRNAKRRELGGPLISADILQEEKLWIKRAEAELEEEKLAMEARRRMEEIEAEQAAALAKKRAEEEAARQKREMEAQKRAQEARIAQEQMMQRKAQEEAKKQEQKPPSSGPIQTQLQFAKPPASKENPPAAGNQPQANENKMKKPAGGEKTTGNPALDDTIVIDADDDKNQEEAAPGGNILPADILGNNAGGGEDPFIKELIGNAQMSQGEIEALKKAKTVAMNLKQQALNARLNPEETAFIVTLKNIPKNWNDDMLKQRLMQMQRRVEGVKVAPETNTALLRVTGLRDAIRLYILDEQNIDGFVIQAEIKISQKQKTANGPGPGPSQNMGGPGIGGGIGIGPGPGANVSVTTGGSVPQGYPMQGRTIRTITNPFPGNNNTSTNNPPQQQQQQQMGGNRFQTNPNVNMNPQQQSFPSPGPRFGQSTGMGQSPAFGQPGFGQGNQFMTSPSLGGRQFGAPPMKFGQTSMPSPGLPNQGGGFGGFGGQGQGGQNQQQFMGFQGAMQQQNQIQGNGGFMGGGQNQGNSAADFFGAPRR